MRLGVRLLSFGLVLASLPALMGCGRSATTHPNIESKVSPADSVSDLTGDALLWADSLTASMTLEQRVGQLFMPAVYASDDAATLRLLRSYVADLHIGGVVLLKGDLRAAASLADTLQKLSETGLFVAIDAEWGLRMRLDDAPDFPDNSRLGAKATEELMYEYGREMARECRSIGINMLLGPVVDVVEGRSGAIGRRSFGSDPRRVAELSVAYAKGVESGGVMSVAKHFPGHGSPLADSHKTLPVITRDMASLDSIDLYPFRRYIDSGLSGVMVGHLAVSAVDSVLRPAAMSPLVVRGLLLEQLGFKGLVLTDALNMGAAAGYEAWTPIAAGADVVVAPESTAAAVSSAVKAVLSGDLAVKDIDRACRKVLAYKYLTGAGLSLPVSSEMLYEVVASDEAADIRSRLRQVSQ